MLAALRQERLDEAADVLARATAEGQVAAAVLHVVQREASFTRSFGKAQTADAMFLLGSISKPIAVTALMTLFDRGEFKLDDPLQEIPPAVHGRRSRPGDDATLADARLGIARSVAGEQ